MVRISGPNGVGLGSRGADEAARGDLVFAISADYERRTGGWVYDARLMQELGRIGWNVRELILPAGYPYPSAQARAQSAVAFAALPDGALVVVDQLCLGVLPEVARREAQRLRLTMIVHHPLALEQKDAGASTAFAQSEREALRHVRSVIVTSNATAKFLSERFGVDPKRVLIAVPGTDPSPIAEGSGCTTTSILSVGAVVPRKDHGTLIAALEALRDVPWQLTIAGNVSRAPEHVAEIRALIRVSGLADRVRLVGELDHSALEELWRSADLYVAASRHEGYGMAISEAISRGLPVVTTAAGAVTEWLSSRAALIVPQGDMAALRTALARVLRERELRAALRRGAREQRVELPRWPETAARVDAALARLLIDARGPNLLPDPRPWV